jgi:hypothetical protein
VDGEAHYVDFVTEVAELLKNVMRACKGLDDLNSHLEAEPKFA